MPVTLRIILIIFVIFILPALATMLWWQTIERPGSWRQADWSATGILPPPQLSQKAAIHILSARTGGLKGAFSTHSWIVLKRPGESRYERYDKVGWGAPIRRNNYAADARWYSNEPEIIASLNGPPAARLIPAIDAAIAAYPWASQNGYRLYPGPNSNTFIAHILRSVPDIGTSLPPNAVGRDFLPAGDFIHLAPDGRDLSLSLYGLAGLSLGARSGFELHLFGLVAGVDFHRPAIKVPAWGLVSLW